MLLKTEDKTTKGTAAQRSLFYLTSEHPFRSAFLLLKALKNVSFLPDIDQRQLLDAICRSFLLNRSQSQNPISRLILRALRSIFLPEMLQLRRQQLL